MIFGNKTIEESTVEGLAILLYNNFLKPNKDTYNVNMISHSFITCPEAIHVERHTFKIFDLHHDINISLTLDISSNEEIKIIDFTSYHEHVYQECSLKKNGDFYRGKLIYKLKIIENNFINNVYSTKWSDIVKTCETFDSDNANILKLIMLAPHRLRNNIDELNLDLVSLYEHLDKLPTIILVALLRSNYTNRYTLQCWNTLYENIYAIIESRNEDPLIKLRELK